MGTKYSTVHATQPVVRAGNRPRTLACRVHVHVGRTQVTVVLRPADGRIQFPAIVLKCCESVYAMFAQVMFISLLTMDDVQFVPFSVHWPGIVGYISPCTVLTLTVMMIVDSTAQSGTRSRWWVRRLMK
jgi:hypothetical protein